MINSILCVFWAFLVSIFAIPSIINVAHLKQLLDEPNLRTVHMSLTPRLGGIAIFAGFASAITIFGEFDTSVQQILAGSIILFFIGLKDDIVTVSPFKKFFVQLLATGIVIFIGDVRITSFQGFLGIQELSITTSYLFSGLLIIGLTNAINLIDGIDGLAGTITFFICIVFGFYLYHSESNFAIAYAEVAFCLAGSVVGFLRYNFKKAIIFMGDTGSLVCGYIISILAIKFIESKPVENSPAIALAVVVIPFFDTLRVLILRIFNGKSPFFPDKNHIHHILKSAGFNSQMVVLIILGINMLFLGISLFMSNYSVNVVVLTLVIMLLTLSIVLELIKKFGKENI